MAEDIERKAPKATENKPERKKTGCLMKGMYWTISILAVLALALACWNHYLDGEAEKNLADARALVDELQPEPVPDEDNAAPIYIQAFAAIRAAGSRAAPNIQSRLSLCELEIGSKEVGTLLKNHQAVLAELATAAGKPQCAFPTDYRMGLMAPTPSLLELRGAAVLLAIAARRAAHEGRFEEAIGQVGQILHMSRGLSEVRMLICHMIGQACAEIATDALRDILNETEPDAAALRAALKYLGPV